MPTAPYSRSIAAYMCVRRRQHHRGHYGLSFPAFTRSGVRIRAETCLYYVYNARGYYLYAPTVCTHYRSRKRTYPRIRTRVRVRTRFVNAPSARVYTPTRVYAPSVRVNALSHVYTWGAHSRTSLRLRTMGRGNARRAAYTQRGTRPRSMSAVVPQQTLTTMATAASTRTTRTTSTVFFPPRMCSDASSSPLLVPSAD